MTTHTFSGFRISDDGFGNPTLNPTTMTMVTSDTFFFRYSMDNPVDNDFSDITVNPSIGRLHYTAMNGTRFDLTGTASVGELAWGDNKKTMLLRVEGLIPGTTDYFVMAGAALPDFATGADAEAFLAGVDGVNSVITGYINPVRPNANITMSRFTSITNTTQDDTFIAVPGLDDWSANELKSGAGNDNIIGASGNDKIDAGTGDDYVEGRGGNDSINGFDGNDEIYGGNGDDSIAGGKGNDSLYGGAGKDNIRGGDGDDLIDGGDGDDRLDGDTGNDSMFGGAGNDVMFGGDGRDLMEGDAGDDRMSGGKGNDTMRGGAGNDTVNGGTGNDLLEGDDGDDLIIGGAGNDQMFGGTGNDRLNGGNGNDLMDGGAGADTLNGGGGNDTLDGGDGDDVLIGGAGADRFIGGAGDDTMTGGKGADVFVFADGFGEDVITDFKSGEDLIEIGAFAGADAAEILALGVQEGRDVVFDFGADGMLTLARVSLEALQESDFLIV
ncbi:MAG: calcium-binding protein [Gemmobacter sp.]